MWCKVKGMMGKELTEAKAKGKEAKGKKIGRPLKILSADVTKKAIEAARLGIPLERIAVGCGFWNNGQGWQNYLARNPAFAAELEQARFQGELELSSVVRTCGPGWQGSAWLLESLCLSGWHCIKVTVESEESSHAKQLNLQLLNEDGETATMSLALIHAQKSSYAHISSVILQRWLHENMMMLMICSERLDSPLFSVPFSPH